MPAATGHVSRVPAIRYNLTAVNTLKRLRRTTRARLIAAVLLALALRSLIPIGFMPAMDGTFSLVMCEEGLPPGLLPAAPDRSMPGGMVMPGHPGHGHGDADGGHCSFCTGFSAAPPTPLLAAALCLLLAGIAVVVTTAVPPAGVRLVCLPQARAPPAPV